MDATKKKEEEKMKGVPSMMHLLLRMTEVKK
jgi:hypothetical protein